MRINISVIVEKSQKKRAPLLTTIRECEDSIIIAD